ncbi:ribonuclease H-like YkuK family protein [Candidatus Gottesmanbacteria bacterium]|nr:ribonuclease H-like YkuK family protein [Candidatus Gottesmanbacteria bacterium]
MFNSPTFGSLSLEEVRKKILQFMANKPEYKYQLVIGSDSQPKNGHGCDFVTAIVVHRLGLGGIYFWKRIVETKSFVLRTRIYQEATLSLSTAEEFLRVFKNDGITKYDVEIHVDIGKFGQTREMISEVVGMIRGSGFIVKTKPESYGASKVADRHT